MCGLSIFSECHFHRVLLAAPTPHWRSNGLKCKCCHTDQLLLWKQCQFIEYLLCTTWSFLAFTSLNPNAHWFLRRVIPVWGKRKWGKESWCHRVVEPEPASRTFSRKTLWNKTAPASLLFMVLACKGGESRGHSHVAKMLIIVSSLTQLKSKNHLACCEKFPCLHLFITSYGSIFQAGSPVPTALVTLTWPVTVP